MTIYNILVSILSKSGNNDKIDELRKHADNTFLTEYIRAMLSPSVNFFVKKYDKPSGYGNNEFDKSTLDDIVAKLSTRALTGHAAVEYVNNLASSLDKDGQELLKWLLDKGMRGGLGISMVNKAYGYELVWDASKHYMRCSLPTDKIISNFNWDNAVCQVKHDGAYIEIGRDIGIRTRSGNCFPSGVLPFHADDIDGIIMGEIVVYEDCRKLPRQESNGILNSALQGTPIPAGYNVLLHVWDYRPDDINCDMPYNSRLAKLDQIISGRHNIMRVESVPVKNYSEALAFASSEIKLGGEGAILKDTTMTWKSGTSKQQIKLKVECDVDLIATELIQGSENGKHADTFGSIRCQTSDGKLVVDVSGISDAQRMEIFDDPSIVLGKIVTVTFNDIIQSDNSDKPSLFLPRFGNKVDGKFLIRNDKSEADDLPRVIQIFEAATGIRKTF